MPHSLEYEHHRASCKRPSSALTEGRSFIVFFPVLLLSASISAGYAILNLHIFIRLSTSYLCMRKPYSSKIPSADKKNTDSLRGSRYSL